MSKALLCVEGHEKKRWLYGKVLHPIKGNNFVHDEWFKGVCEYFKADVDMQKVSHDDNLEVKLWVAMKVDSWW